MCWSKPAETSEVFETSEVNLHLPPFAFNLEGGVNFGVIEIMIPNSTTNEFVVYNR